MNGIPINVSLPDIHPTSRACARRARDPAVLRVPQNASMLQFPAHLADREAHDLFDEDEISEHGGTFHDFVEALPDR